MSRRPSFSGRFVEVKRATRTRRRLVIPKGRILCVLDDVIEIDGVEFVPVIYHGRLQYVRTDAIRLIGRVGPSSKKKTAKKTATKKRTSKKKSPKRKRAKK